MDKILEKLEDLCEPGKPYTLDKVAIVLFAMRDKMIEMNLEILKLKKVTK